MHTRRSTGCGRFGADRSPLGCRVYISRTGIGISKIWKKVGFCASKPMTEKADANTYMQRSD